MIALNCQTIEQLNYSTISKYLWTVVNWKHVGEERSCFKNYKADTLLQVINIVLPVSSLDWRTGKLPYHELNTDFKQCCLDIKKPRAKLPCEITSTSGPAKKRPRTIEPPQDLKTKNSRNNPRSGGLATIASVGSKLAESSSMGTLMMMMQMMTQMQQSNNQQMQMMMLMMNLFRGTGNPSINSSPASGPTSSNGSTGPEGTTFSPTSELTDLK